MGRVLSEDMIKNANPGVLDKFVRSLGEVKFSRSTEVEIDENSITFAKKQYEKVKEEIEEKGLLPLMQGIEYRACKAVTILRRWNLNISLMDDPDKAVKTIEQVIRDYKLDKEKSSEGREVLYRDIVEDEFMVRLALTGGNIEFVKRLIPVTSKKINNYIFERALETKKDELAIFVLENQKDLDSAILREYLEFAIKNEFKEIIPEIFRKGVAVTNRHMELAIEQDFLDGVVILLDRLPKEQITDRYLFSAIKNYSPEIVLALIEKGAMVTEGHKKYAKMLLDDDTKAEPGEKDYLKRKVNNIISILNDPEAYIKKAKHLEGVDDFVVKSKQKRVRSGSPIPLTPDRIEVVRPKGFVPTAPNLTNVERQGVQVDRGIF